jgi:hypothetical protein
LEAFLTENRRVEKRLVKVRDQLERARIRMQHCFALWRHLEDRGKCLQSELRQVLGGEQDQWRGFAERWGSMGIIVRTESRGSYDLVPATNMGQTCGAKCSGCGKIVREPKRVLLARSECPICGRGGVHLALCD